MSFHTCTLLSDLEHTCKMYFCRSPSVPSDSDSDSELSEEEHSSSYASSHSSDSEDDDVDVKPKWNNERTPVHSTPKSMCMFRPKPRMCWYYSNRGVIRSSAQPSLNALLDLGKLQWEVFSK